MESLAKRNYLSELREIDWDFPGSSGTEGLSNFHWHPARFPPALPAILISYLTSPGDTVLDPFCGSGTTLVEGYGLGRRVIGVDTNPVATLMSSSKLLPFARAAYDEYLKALRQICQDLLLDPDPGQVLAVVPSLEENARWYHHETLRELAVVWQALRQTSGEVYHVASLAAFSSILRFACSQNKHWGWICDNVRPKILTYKPALTLFFDKLRDYARERRSSAAPVPGQVASDVVVQTGPAQAVLTSLPACSVDAVVTSPPYYGMTDYARAQRLTFLWLEDDLEVARAAESGARFKRRRESSLCDYLDEMAECFSACARVLRPNAACAVVVGESPSRQPYLNAFEEVLAGTGFDLEERLDRQLPTRRALGPRAMTERILLLRRRP